MVACEMYVFTEVGGVGERKRERNTRVKGGGKKMSAGTPGISATQKGKIQWWGATYEQSMRMSRW
jgi:hypothetical protein